ncbi:MAG: protein FlbA [Candidatus Tectimicrobiota bacterium]|nr:MAG: protein FlbA [Candidatus Tectomicrobia bacterium]
MPTAPGASLRAAVACYRRAVQLQPEAAELHNNLGILLKAQGQYAAARQHYERAIALRPDWGVAYANLGHLCWQQGERSQAIQYYQQALACDPTLPEVYNNLGLAYLEQRQWEAARACLQQALAYRPDYAEAHNNLGLVYLEHEEFAAALAHLQQALRLRPDYAEAYLNLGAVLERLGRLEAALRTYEACLQLQPARAKAHWNRALVHLQQGRLGEGWAGYEWRWQLPEHRPRSFPFVPWQGERFERGTLVVSAEQGLGDELLFASCLPDALERTGHLVLECDPRLAPLLARSLPRVTVVGQGRHHTGWTKRLPAGTRHCPAGSLPRWLRPTLEAFFPQRLRLRAAPNQIRRWRSWLAGLGPGLKVGVLWRSLRQRAQQGHYAPVGQWQRLWALEGIWWVSLQYDGGKEELEALGETRVVVPELDVWGDLEGVAGLLAGLDLVVGPETALVQLGGALGRRVWCVVAYPGSWPQLGTGGMPWWEGVRYWVAPGPGRWEELFSAMAQELTQLAQQATTDSYAPDLAGEHMPCGVRRA